MRRHRISKYQRQCIIDATIEPLLPYPKGFARTKAGPFYKADTVDVLIKIGALRSFWRGNRLLLTARAA